MRRSESEDWQGNCNKIFEGRKNVNVMFLWKFKKPILFFQIKVFFIVFFFGVSYMFIIFHSYFRVSSEQQSGRGHITIRLQIYKIINYNCEIIEKIKIWPHIEFPENNFELSRSHSFQLQHKRKLLHHLSTFTLTKLRPLCGDTHWSD